MDWRYCKLSKKDALAPFELRENRMLCKIILVLIRLSFQQFQAESFTGQLRHTRVNSARTTTRKTPNF